MVKYWGYFAGFACFSECFLSIRDVVWLWALLVGCLWALLVLESFLEGFGNVGE